MTWQQFRQRQNAIQAVLQYCYEHPAATLTPDAVPGAQRIFANRDELLAALQYKWAQALIGRVDLALAGVTDQHTADRVESVTAAWNRTATDNPALRHALDRHAETAGPLFAAALRREGRLLAIASGLAQADDPHEMIERAGTALRAWLAPPSSGDQRDSAGSVRAEA